MVALEINPSWGFIIAEVKINCRIALTEAIGFK
jgi:hypothetical protein